MNAVKEVFGDGGLRNKVSVYVPSTGNVNEALDQSTADAAIESVLSALSTLFGGATAIRATGGWVSPKAGLVTEEVTIVYSFCGELDKASLVSIKQLCVELKARLGQEAIALEVNSVLHFI